MNTVYTYHCSVTEIKTEESEVNPVLEAHTEDHKVHASKDAALCELRDIIDAHCSKPLVKEIERLNRVVAVLDRRLADALTVSG